MVGKVNRSKTRNFREKLRLRLIPVYAVYRCHNCNWRGWLVRSTASPFVTRLLVGGYVVIAVCVITALTFYIIKHWPAAHYKY
ncbi:MAG TPA: hypothetical protein VHI13_10170 [Candidatus Kapabacteria bacterium]|nr:hypothetical protein [Candidatus Kapabacteria bacterium]